MLNDRTKPIHFSVVKFGFGFGTVQPVFDFHEKFSDEVSEEATESTFIALVPLPIL